MSNQRTRGWGPFTGNQLTVILTAAILAIGVPAGSMAAGSLSKIVISNAGGGATAGVVEGRLKVSAVVPGTVSAQLKGTVPVQQVERQPFFDTAEQIYTNCNPIVTAPPNRKIVVTRVDISISAVPSGVGYVALYTTPDCDGGPVRLINPEARTHDVEEFDPGLPLAPGAGLYALHSTGIDAGATAQGYVLP